MIPNCNCGYPGTAHDENPPTDRPVCELIASRTHRLPLVVCAPNYGIIPAMGLTSIYKEALFTK